MTIHENIEVGSLTYFGCRCRLVRMVPNVVLRAPGATFNFHHTCSNSVSRCVNLTRPMSFYPVLSASTDT